jgi:hypothetical protein
MKQFFSTICFFFFIFFVLMAQTSTAQTKADVFDAATDVTWLGLDFSKAQFLGNAYQFGEAGEITNSQLVNTYIPSWNQLFITEAKKFDVAGAIRRTAVNYYLDATAKSNSEIKNNFFINNSADLILLNEKEIANLVKGYNFQQSNTGIGLMFIVERLDKSQNSLTAWITFINLKTKTVLLTVRESGKPMGFGFRNFWAGGFYNILKNLKSDFRKWNN